MFIPAATKVCALELTVNNSAKVTAVGYGSEVAKNVSQLSRRSLLEGKLSYD